MVRVLAGWDGDTLGQVGASPALTAATAAAAAAAPMTCSWWRRIAAAAASAAIASACSQARRRRAATLNDLCWWRADVGGARWRAAAAAGQIVDVRPLSDEWCRTGPAQHRHSSDEESVNMHQHTTSHHRSHEISQPADIYGLTAEHLQYSHPAISVLLPKFFLLMVVSHCIPNGFKHSYIMPKLISKVKDCRESYMSCDDFRGIAISPILQVFEHCLLKQLQAFIEKEYTSSNTGNNWKFVFRLSQLY